MWWWVGVSGEGVGHHCEEGRHTTQKDAVVPRWGAHHLPVLRERQLGEDVECVDREQLQPERGVHHL